MLNNAKIKNLGLVLLAAVLPALAFITDTTSAVVPMSLLSAVVLAALVAVAPWWLSAVVPVAVYGLCLLISGDYYLSALPLTVLPAGVCGGVCMRRMCSRGFTVALVSFALVVGALLCFGILTLALYGTISFSAIKECYNTIYSLIVDAVYENVYNVLKVSVEEYGYTESFVATYTAAFLRSYRPMLFGTVIFTCNVVAYALTAISKRILKYADVAKYERLPGINGDWEFVLSKSSAVVFILCYFCLLIGGDSLTLPQASAFYAVMLAIVGGVFVMAFRSIRNRVKLTGGVDLIVIGIVMFLFFQSSIMDIVSMVLAVIGLSATFKSGKKEEGGNEKI